MGKKAKKIALIAIFLMLVLVVLMVVWVGNLTNPIKGPDQPKYIFIDVQTIENRTAIGGETTTGKHLIGSWPVYFMRGSNLQSSEIPKLDSSAKAIFGNDFRLSGNAGWGHVRRLYIIRDLPYTHGNITVLDIKGDNVSLSHDGSIFTLKPGDSWKNETHYIEKDDYGVQEVANTTVIDNRGVVYLTPIME
jgi:hypothetical protein